MERDPLRLAWRAAPGLNLAALALLILAGIVLLTGIDLIRILLDGLGGADAKPLLRLAFTLPGRWGETPLVLFSGIPFTSRPDDPALLGALVVVPLLLAASLALTQTIGAGIGAKLAAGLRGAILDGVLSARPSARDDAERAAAFAGESLSRESAFLGSAIISAVQFAGIATVALLSIAAVDPRLALAAGALLVLGALLGLRRLRLRGWAIQAIGREGGAIAGAAADLLRRLPALRAHGTGGFERERLNRDWLARHRPVERSERRLGRATAASSAALFLTPIAVLVLGGWLGRDQVGLGALVAAAAAAALAALSVRELVRWQRALDEASRWLSAFSDALAALRARAPGGAATALPRAGDLVARGVSAYDARSGTRISGIDCTIAFPTHAALVGDESARVLAALIAGQLDPSTGRLTYGGVDLVAIPPAERARRIAFAGGDTILLAAPLRENLVYGSENVPETRLMEAVATAGLDGLVHGRGLDGAIDPSREGRLAAEIVEARRAVQDGLKAEGLDRFVDPFDSGAYNQHATIGENLLFGFPVGETFREERLAGHAFVRAVLEAAELTKPLTVIGLSVATSMIEIFADIPAGHPLFERYAFFSAGERGYFEDLVERRAERRRQDSGRERERLIGLALRYNESRHRLGLVDESLKDRIVAARADFSRMLPPNLRPAIEFFDAGRLCVAASVQDNLLFGRVAVDQAGAEEAVNGLIRRVLTGRGLDAEVVRIGLDRNIDPRADDLASSDVAAIDLVRCLVRDPDVVVVERALDGLTAAQADGLVVRLRRFLTGRGLVLVTSALSSAMDSEPFDLVLRFERGVLREEERAMPLEPREAIPA